MTSPQSSPVSVTLSHPVHNPLQLWQGQSQLFQLWYGPGHETSILGFQQKAYWFLGCGSFIFVEETLDSGASVKTGLSRR